MVAAWVATTIQVPGAVGALHYHTAGVLEDLHVSFLGIPASEESTMSQEQEINAFYKYRVLHNTGHPNLRLCSKPKGAFTRHIEQVLAPAYSLSNGAKTMQACLV